MAHMMIRRVIVGVLVVPAALLAVRPSHAEPYIATRTGYQCSACHVNQTGGGKRTMMGSDYGLYELPGYTFPLPEDERFFTGTFSRRFSVGADFRGVGESRFTATETTNQFATQEMNLYGEVELLRDRLRLYADVKLAPGGTQTREIVALVENLPGKLYVKAGRFFAPYGWRLLDDEAFIRARTGFNFQSPDDGIELGWQPGDFFGALAVTNGNGGAADDNTNKRVSALASWARPRFRIGGSLASNRQGDVSSQLAGLMAGVKLHERLVALGELDFGRDEDDATGMTTRRILAYGELDILVPWGLNLKTAFDYEDPDNSESGDEVNRVTLAGEWFATQYLQFRLLWRRIDRPPEVRGVSFEDERELVIEAHLYL